jgi:hypothetical protein
MRLKRLFLVVSVCLLFCCLLPFLLLSLYSQIQADDFIIANELAQNGFITTQSKWYFEWSGRYSAFAIVCFLLKYVYPVFGNLSFISISIQLIFLGSAWYFLSSLFRTASGVTRLFIFGLLLLSYYWRIPSPVEAFYWISSSYSYQLGVSLNLLFFGLLIRKEYTKRVFQQCLLVILVVLIPGTCEINILVLGWGLLSILVWELWNYKRLDQKLAIIAITGLCCSIFSICAPGNQVRSTIMQGQSIGNPGDSLFAFQAAFITAKQQVIELFIKTPLLLFSFAFVWGLSNSGIRPIQPLSGKLLLMVGIFFCFTYLTFYLPFPYLTGDGILPGRVINITTVFFLVGWYLMLYLSRGYFSRLKTPVIPNQVFRTMAVILIILFAFQLRYPNRIKTAWSDLLTGNASGYKNQITTRLKLIVNHQHQQISFPPLKNIPLTLFFSDLDSNASDWKNVAYAKYYDLDSVRIDILKN